MTRTHRNITLLRLYQFFSYFLPSSPIIILYFHDVVGSYTTALGLLAVQRMAASLFELPTGILSDFVGRKYTLILSAIAFIASFVCYALATSVLLLAIGVLCSGLGFALASGTIEAMLYESLAENGASARYADEQGKISSSHQLGLSLGALAGIPLIVHSMQLAVWGSVIAQSAMLLTSLFLVEPRRQQPQDAHPAAHFVRSLRAVWGNTKLRWMTGLSGVRGGVADAVYQFAPVFVATLWPLWAISAMRVISNGLSVAGFWYAGRIIAWLQPMQTIVVFLASNRLLSIIGVLMQNAASPLLIAIPSFGFGCVSTAEQTVQQAEFSDRERATMGSVTSFVRNTFTGMLYLLFGWLGDLLSAREALLIGEIFFVAVLIGYVWLLAHYRKTDAKLATAHS